MSSEPGKDGEEFKKSVKAVHERMKEAQAPASSSDSQPAQEESVHEPEVKPVDNVKKFKSQFANDDLRRLLLIFPETKSEAD
mmetsp:Transcript_19224/g.29473  ORF Transcript_19224/g.29473 Transcript_19224/m.29473 type:complete len:82 (-) Transcript_19224:609-854(-)|eukprot:CAMPEP_0170497574 /NCGR_PEP_ID=MMETSP0208-20121228/25088_1 /TAXON_ID=197538 /ORGANISM="Strombidium inclinatum, Strain S3" /LENGTH=81 /DNA_ID=CAMNT_0010774433 /DNA_START=232 /DNA_END=477 /DNA_ORIENTATION=+